MITLSEDVKRALEDYVVDVMDFVAWYRIVSPENMWDGAPTVFDVKDYVYCQTWAFEKGAC